MTEIRTGGCLCGAIHYLIEGGFIIGGACYCRDWQYTSGGSPAHGLMFSSNALALTKGIPATFSQQVASGNTVYRQFCSTCGVHMISWSDAAPEMRAIKVGTLDDPSVYHSNGSLWVGSAQSWHRPDPDLPQYSMMPCLAEIVG